MQNYSAEPGCVTILYGSETGNAEDYARYLWQKLQYHQLKPVLSSLDEYPLKNLVTETKFLIIVCSTTGQGELPRNAKKFMKFLLKKKLPGDLFNHIKLTTFGLGDSSYSKFNYGIKKIHTRLLQLGCSEFSPRCEADEMSPEGLDGFYKEWESQCIENLNKYFPDLVDIDEDYVLPPVNPVVIQESSEDIITNGNLSLTRTKDNSALHIGTIRVNERITKGDHFQDVRHVVFESQDLKYLPGDTVGLYPINDSQGVDLLIQSQPHWIPIADKPLSIQHASSVEGGFIEREKITLRSLFTYHLDIVGIPTRSFFQTLWHFTDDSSEDGEREKEKLREFASFEDTEELYNYANRPRRSILETILEFEKNLTIPTSHIFDLFPKIKPRLFSIASRPSPTQVELVVGIVEYKTMIRRIRRGLCSKWLKQLVPEDQLVFSTHKTSLNFSLPHLPNPPLIMIAPGTGIAPMKSLIEHIAGSDVQQELYLFYGCRYQSKDFLFENLWTDLTSQKKLHLFPAFSRDPESKAKYVQDRLFLESDILANLIMDQEAIVFICGSSGKMPKQVRITLAEVLVKARGLPEDEAQKYILSMEDNGRYKEDTW